MIAALMVSLWAVAAGVCDWRWRRLPNALTMGGIATGFAWLVLAPTGPLGASRTDSFLALGLVMGLMLPGYARGLLGAGDVKLGMAMGLLGGTGLLVDTLLSAALVGGCMALTVLFRRLLELGQWPSLELVLTRVGWCPHRAPTDTPRRVLPLGTALALGFVAATGGIQWLPA